MIGPHHQHYFAKRRVCGVDVEYLRFIPNSVRQSIVRAQRKAKARQEA